MFVFLFLSLCACSSSDKSYDNSNKSYDELLSGEWIWKEYPDNPMYMFMKFEDDTVRYGANLFGQEIENATWDCTYSISDDKLKITTNDGTVFEFDIQYSGSTIKIFDDEGHEFIHTDR